MFHLNEKNIIAAILKTFEIMLNILWQLITNYQ